MTTEKICPQCGNPLSGSAPYGLCPDCLMKAALGTGVSIGPETDDESKHARGFVPPSPEEIAGKFPELEIVSLLGRGGMGAVYKARQTRLDRLVALKILPPGLQADTSFAERFVREAQALARLHHPNIVTLFEFGETEGLFYFLMEFVDGVNLRQLMSNGRVSPREALAIVPQICEALQYAHDLGIVHRDIKPENILVNRQGQVKIADFGVARILEKGGERSTTTESGRVVGTPQYMAPEQVTNPGEVDHRADIYALGVVFYQMLTGQMPSGRLDPPSRHVTIDVRLDEIVMRALEKEPELRFQQASEIKTRVETITRDREAGSSSSQRDSTDQATGTSKTVAIDFANREPARLSRAAVWGAAWAPLFLINSLLFLQARAVVSTPGQPPPGREWWQLLLIMTVLPLGLCAPFGTTILGWIAISNIRHSAGKVYGLGLALADALLFPLLALTAGIGYFANSAVKAYIRYNRELNLPVGPSLKLLIENQFATAALLTVLTATPIAYLIIRRVWQAASRPLGVATGSGSHSFDKSVNPESSRSRNPVSFGNFALLVALFTFAFAMFTMLNSGIGAFSFLAIPALAWLAVWVVSLSAGNRPFSVDNISKQNRTTSELTEQKSRDSSRRMLVSVVGVIAIGLAISGAIRYMNDLKGQHAKSASTDQPGANHDDLPASFTRISDENLVRNPSMEYPGEANVSPAHWAKYAPMGGVEYIWDRRVAHSGKASLCIKTKRRLDFRVFWQQTIPLDPSRPANAQYLEVGVWAKAEQVMDARIYLEFHDSRAQMMKAWTQYIGPKEPSEPSLTQDWKHFTTYVAIPDGQQGFDVVLALYGPGTIWYDDVTVRYAAEANTPEPSRQVASDDASGSAAESFASPVELVIPDLTTETACLLDFESGKLLVPDCDVMDELNETVPHFSSSVLRWLRDSGADAFLSPDGSIHILEGAFMSPRIQGRPLTWDEIKASDVISTTNVVSEEQREAARSQPSFNRTALRAPAAVIFITRERGLGVFQIRASLETPRGVAVRYRLVQDAFSSNTTAMNAETGPEDSAASPSSDTDTKAPETTGLSGRREAVATSTLDDHSERKIERVIHDRRAGTNGFLDLDTGKLLTPPREIVDTLNTTNTELNDILWQSVGTEEVPRPARYIEWLRESGADLLYLGEDMVIGFDGLFAHTDLTAWQNLPPWALREAWAAWDFKTQPPTRNRKRTFQSSHLRSSGDTSAPEQERRAAMLTADQSRTWFFKTREGKMGVLELAGFSESPRGLKIVYELMGEAGEAIADTNTTSGAINEFAGSPSFGPVIERDLMTWSDETTGPKAIDLDSCRVEELGSSDTLQRTLWNRDWVRINGVDLATFTFSERPAEHGHYGLFLPNTIMSDQLGTDHWTSTSAEILARDINDLLVPAKQRGGGYDFHSYITYNNEVNLPTTYAFKTQGGGMGLLQVVGFTENPSGLKIRYKLLRTADTITSAPSAAMSKSATQQSSVK